MSDKNAHGKPSPQKSPAEAAAGINTKLLGTVGVSLEAYIGSTQMTVAELLSLKQDSVVPLQAALNQPVELRLNGVAIAKGELVAVGDNFAIRLIEVSR